MGKNKTSWFRREVRVTRLLRVWILACTASVMKWTLSGEETKGETELGRGKGFCCFGVTPGDVLMSYSW